jgi:hypothetical protein
MFIHVYRLIPEQFRMNHSTHLDGFEVVRRQSKSAGSQLTHNAATVARGQGQRIEGTLRCLRYIFLNPFDRRSVNPFIEQHWTGLSYGSTAILLLAVVLA